MDVKCVAPAWAIKKSTTIGMRESAWNKLLGVFFPTKCPKKILQERVVMPVSMKRQESHCRLVVRTQPSHGWDRGFDPLQWYLWRFATVPAALVHIFYPTTNTSHLYRRTWSSYWNGRIGIHRHKQIKLYPGHGKMNPFFKLCTVDVQVINFFIGDQFDQFDIACPS